MASTPFRPAREIVITVRRTARNDPANYDSTPTAPAPSRSASGSDIVNAHQGRPRWWPAFSKTAIAVAATGVLIIAADLHVLGGIITAVSVASWGLARIAAFYDRDPV